MADIDACLVSMLRQSYSDYTITVIDNCSTDGTAEHVKSRYPAVSVVVLPENIGYRRGNSLGMATATGDFVVVCNDDVEVEHGWLQAMVEAMVDSRVGLVTPMILMDQDRSIINSAGNTLHFSGMTGPRGKGESLREHETSIPVAAVSGCCFMIRRNLLGMLGGFSADFDALDVGWHASFEDVDLGWRVQMAGYRIEYAPAAVMYHKYKQPGLFPGRFAAYEWGRYLVVLRNYRLVTLAGLFPFLVLLEILAWGYAFSRGLAYVKAKARVMRWLLTHGATIASMREKAQKFRVASDAYVLERMDRVISLAGPVGRNALASSADKVFGIFSRMYYRVLLFLVRAVEGA